MIPNIFDANIFLKKGAALERVLEKIEGNGFASQSCLA